MSVSDGCLPRVRQCLSLRVLRGVACLRLGAGVRLIVMSRTPLKAGAISLKSAESTGSVRSHKFGPTGFSAMPDQNTTQNKKIGSTVFKNPKKGPETLIREHVLGSPQRVFRPKNSAQGGQRFGPDSSLKNER
jgi:hypothetical protein